MQATNYLYDKARYYDIETVKLLNMIEKKYENDIFIFETSQSNKILIKTKYILTLIMDTLLLIITSVTLRTD